MNNKISHGRQLSICNSIKREGDEDIYKGKNNNLYRNTFYQF